MLLNHMVEMKGKNFRISEAEKVAVQMAGEKITTVEAAEEFFTRDEQAYNGMKKVLKLMGKRYMPSEAQVSLYRKWTKDWGFTHEAIEAALELTAKGDPSTGYLDGILNSLRQENGNTAGMTPEQIRNSTVRAEGLRDVLKILGKGEVSQRNILLYDQMKALYPQKVILTAARECGHNGKDTEEVLKLLQAWKEKGLEKPQDVEAYVQAFHDQNAMIREIRQIWGTDEKRISKTDRSLLTRWEKEMGFSRQMILAAASYATEARQPMSYLDRILTDYKQKGITTPDQARKDHESRKTGSGKPAKVLPAQDFIQRDYSGVQNEMLQSLAQEMEAFKRGNGGESDA